MRGTTRENIGGTLIHELSHAVAGTVDVMQGGNVVTGAEAAIRLARNPAGAVFPAHGGGGGGGASALDNAENYGFFCMALLAK